jgi:hypothetical protein
MKRLGLDSWKVSGWLVGTESLTGRARRSRPRAVAMKVAGLFVAVLGCGGWGSGGDFVCINTPYLRSYSANKY